jgi:hypothetical protein
MIYLTATYKYRNNEHYNTGEFLLQLTITSTHTPLKELRTYWRNENNSAVIPRMWAS